MAYFKAKCTKFGFGWGSAPDPAGELTALPQTPLLDLRPGVLLLREGEGGKGKRGRKGKEEERGGRALGGREGEKVGGTLSARASSFFEMCRRPWARQNNSSDHRDSKMHLRGRNTYYEPSRFVIGPAVWLGRGAKNTIKW